MYETNERAVNALGNSAHSQSETGEGCSKYSCAVLTAEVGRHLVRPGLQSLEGKVWAIKVHKAVPNWKRATTE